MRVRMLAALVLPATLLTLACNSNAAPTSSSSTAAPTAASTVAAAKSGTSNAAAGAVLGAKFCSDWTDVSAKTPAGGASLGAGTGQSTDAFKASVEASKAQMQALADQAPAEIKPDFQVYAKFWADYANAMGKANYNFVAAAQDPAFLTLMQNSSASLGTAAQHIQAYMVKNCTR
jgi:hypothetical protein